MHKNIALGLAVVLIIVLLGGCRTEPRIEEIKDIPTNAEEVLSLDLAAESGSFSSGGIDISGNGYLILDARSMTGTSKAIEIKDALTSDIVYTISNPTQALYDSSYYDYNIDSEYEISFVDAKDITGTITVYFVEDDSV